jgi:uncharacterized membrane protein YphA (DoxX/SURF4 family)
MSGSGYLSALVLAAIFAWAAAAKLRRPVPTAATFRAIGLPAPAVMARAAPAAELAIAAALVLVPSIGATAALVALAFFTTLLVSRLRDGSPVSCGCFGTASEQPISFVEPLRNLFLAGLAVAALLAPSPSVPGLDDVIATSTAVLAGALVLGLATTKRDVGAIWSTTLAGEARR